MFSNCLPVVLAVCLHLASPLSIPPPSEKILRANVTNSWVPAKNHSRNAYVTLVDSNFHLGAQVLGQSLLESGTAMDLVALCTEAVSADTKEVLKADGWIIRDVRNIPNPHVRRTGSEQYSAFSKLHVWNMTEYERIVFLSSTVLVLSNVDHLFDCGTFCAAYRDTDLFNSGVMVLEPSAAIFKDMTKKVLTLPSYNSGDQGFLNEYFKDAIHAPFFNWSDSKRQNRPMRIPSGFNAETGQYYCLSRWLIPEDELWIIHFSIGWLRPWIWWASRVFDLNWKWTSVRQRLPSHGRGDVFLWPLFWMPYLFVLLFFFTLQYSSCGLNKSNKSLRYFVTFNERFSHFVPMPVAFLSYYLAFAYIVPTTMLPSHAEYVFWLWTSFFLLLFMGTYCHLCHTTNKLQDIPSQSISGKVLQTFVIFCVFTTSHIALTLIPEAVTPFSTRMKFFPALLVLHVLVSQVMGQAVIRVWSMSCTPYCYQDEDDDQHTNKGAYS